MQIYNTLTRQKEEFKPLKKGEVKIYTCGPTVYDYPHIGNLRAYIFADTLRRAFEFQGYQVKHVMNITDVGHLVSDEDAGEDKMEKAAKREKKDPFQIARFYEDEFRKNLEQLNILTPWQMPRATEHIAEQIQMIEKLFQNGYAYIIDDGVYFDVSKFADYGKLSGQNLAEKEAGARVEVRDQKHNPQDFALWKFLVGENAQHLMQWDSPWQNKDGVSKGFPGWHIECSAMSMRYLGETFDLHTGGVDHIPVHHENEIAQSEGATGKKFVNYWMHNEFLRVDGGKMSKSLGNFYKLQDIIDRGFNPLDYRYFCLTAHYRSKLNFTWEALDGARTARQRLNERRKQILTEKIDGAKNNQDLLNDYSHKICAALEDDLNTPQALALFLQALKDYKLSRIDKTVLNDMLDKVFGLGIMEEVAQGKFEKQNVEIPAKILELAQQRQQARQAKNWVEADRLRGLLAEQGYEVKDTAEGFEMVGK